MPIDAYVSVSVTVTAGEWDQIVNQLASGPYRAVAPLIQKIVEQVQRAEQNQGQEAAAQGLPRLQPVS